MLMLGALACLSIALEGFASRAFSTWLPSFFLLSGATSSAILVQPTHRLLIFPSVVSLVVPCWLWVAVLCVVLPFLPSLPGALCSLVSQAVSQLPFVVLARSLLVVFALLPLGPSFSECAVVVAVVLPPILRSPFA